MAADSVSSMLARRAEWLRDRSIHRACGCVLFHSPWCVVFDQIGNRQVGVHRSRVSDAVRRAGFEVYISGVDRFLITILVVKINIAGCHGADEDPEVAVPAAI